MTSEQARVCVFIIISPKCVDSWCLYMYILFLFHTSMMVCQDPKTHVAVARFGNICERRYIIASEFARTHEDRWHVRGGNSPQQCQTHILLSMKYVYELRWIHTFWPIQSDGLYVITVYNISSTYTGRYAVYTSFWKKFVINCLI